MSLFHSTADWWKELAPSLTTINDEPKRMEVSNVVQRQRHSPANQVNFATRSKPSTV